MPAHIYGLIDPRDGEVRYIGKTIGHLDVRQMAHVHDRGNGSRQSRKQRWICELCEAGLMPEVMLIETVPDEEALAAEKRWIGDYVSRGHRLVNSTHATLRPERPNRLEPEEVSPDDLRAFRKRKGITQGTLARMLGYHYSLVSLWENGKRRVPPVVGLALARLNMELPDATGPKPRTPAPAEEAG